MIRKIVFWLHLSVGVMTGLFIFIMAATGVVLAFQRQIINLVDRDIRSVSVPQDAQPRPINELLQLVRRAGVGEPTAIVISNNPQAATQFSIGRSKTVFVDPYCGAVLGINSARLHRFFLIVEQLHRSLGAPLGSKNIGHWLAAVSNLLFGALILLGIFLWFPRKWNWNALRASMLFRMGLRGRAREWNWHSVLGIWCALPLLVIVLTGVVMSFDWANTLLFRLSGSTIVSRSQGEGGRPADTHRMSAGTEPNYEYLLAVATRLTPHWRKISLAIARDASAPISVTIDEGGEGQPQDRTQYWLNRDTGEVVKTQSFASGNLGQRVRAFVRFGHTGEYYGPAGQAIAAFASLGACALVYTGLSLSIRRLTSTIKRRNPSVLRGQLLEVNDLAKSGVQLDSAGHAQKG